MRLAFRLDDTSTCKCGAYDWRGQDRDCSCRQLNVIGDDGCGWFWTYCGPEKMEGTYCIDESGGVFATSFDAIRDFYDWLIWQTQRGAKV